MCVCYRGKRWINTETESKTDRKEMYMDTHLHMFRFIKTKLFPTLSLHGSSTEERDASEADEGGRAD